MKKRTKLDNLYKTLMAIKSDEQFILAVHNSNTMDIAQFIIHCDEYFPLMERVNRTTSTLSSIKVKNN